jgi:hypothetical protein
MNSSRYHGNHGCKTGRITHGGAIRGKPVKEVELRSAKLPEGYHGRKPLVTGFI